MKSYTIFILAALFLLVFSLSNCNSSQDYVTEEVVKETAVYKIPDTNLIPKDKFGEQVRYGRELMLNTSYYIGPDGINGHYLGNKMNCTNCHQDAGTKPYAFNLALSHENYPQYRAREGKVLSLAERVNNCVMRPHNGTPLPLDSKEMLAFLSYLRWINSQLTVKDKAKQGFENLAIQFPERAADPVKGESIYNAQCARCHGGDGGGTVKADGYLYPPIWGDHAYQPGSSMHRIIKQARWLKANMPYDKATYDKPFLSDQDALDVAAFINDDRIHTRPNPKTMDYPYPVEKAIDYGIGPFADGFSEAQHKFGPYQPIIDYWKKKGMKPTY